MISNDKKNILVTGGCGYIGSAVVKRLVELGHNLVVVDNLYKSKRELISDDVDFYNVDIRDKNSFREVFKKYDFNSVMHFAALKAVGESQEFPGKYMDVNVNGTMVLMDLMDEFNVKKIVFSSTACVYSENEVGVYSEDDEILSTNVYGFTKITGENILKEYKKTKEIDYVIFRYFNVAGDVGLNYVDPNAQNIFPIISEVLNGTRDELLVFGDDYETKDGTGVRDYIHLKDLVEAHMKSLEFSGSGVFNLGTKNGTSVLELIDEFKKYGDVKFVVSARRSGDVGKCLANPQKAFDVLGWSAKCSLSEMVVDTVNIDKK